MTVIDHNRGSVALGQSSYVIQPGKISIHGEHPIGRNESHAPVCHLPKSSFQISHITVRIAVAMRLTQPDAVNDTRVIEGIAQDRVPSPSKVSKRPVLASKHELYRTVSS